MSLPRVNTPPESGGSYIIPQLEGERISVPGSNSVFRIFASQSQTNGAMAVFAYDAVNGDTPGFHHHEKAHDIFLVSDGYMRLWNHDRCLILGPGDFASVPPKIVHKPMPIGPVTKAVDLITPGNWVDFFRFVSEPYHGLVMPEFDVRDQVGIMMPKIMELGMEKFQEEYDLIPHPDHVACEVGEWSLEDVNLPDGPAPYYLRANKGPRWMLGGVMSRPFATTKQSVGSFAISSIESSSVYGPSLLARKLSFPNVHHCFVVFEGILGVSVDGYKEACVTPGETCFVGANQPFSISFKSKFVRFWSFASGDGIEALIHEAGKQYQGQILPDTAYDVDEGVFSKCCKQLHVRERGE